MPRTQSRVKHPASTGASIIYLDTGAYSPGLETDRVVPRSSALLRLNDYARGVVTRLSRQLRPSRQALAPVAFLSELESGLAFRKPEMGGKRSESIIAGLKTRLHEGMTANGFSAAAQEEVMRVLANVKEFMFLEFHAYSFASIAYSSAYTRHHYPAAYTCALFNNQPMGFYSPATIANDASGMALR